MTKFRNRIPNGWKRHVSHENSRMKPALMKIKNKKSDDFRFPTKGNCELAKIILRFIEQVPTDSLIQIEIRLQRFRKTRVRIET